MQIIAWYIIYNILCVMDRLPPHTRGLLQLLGIIATKIDVVLTNCNGLCGGG